MCYHISQRQERLEKIMDSFDAEADFEDELLPVYHHLNGFDHGNVMIITQEDPDLIQLGIWGIVLPNYSRDFTEYWDFVKGGALNTKDYKFFVSDEEKDKHPEWKNEAMIYNKCLVIVDGIYEPHHIDGFKPIPHYMERGDSSLFCLWGIYTQHDDLITCSVLTTKANELFSEIHNKAKRMPFCIHPEAKDYYLRMTDEHEIKMEFVDFESIPLLPRPVSRDVTNSHVKSNRTDIIDKVEYPELQKPDTLF